ncbi:MAG TPA: nitrogen fixation protein NifZ [Acidobacteriaceae bacterium]|nr:nitrogen fixation protein NifZ [Acidobacteriaceae bacterium]
MMQADKPRFEWGQRVATVEDLFNDGSYPDHALDALLVGAGEVGEIVQVGRHITSGAVVYMAEFAHNRVIGCMEPELTPWQPKGETK